MDSRGGARRGHSSYHGTPRPSGFPPRNAFHQQVAPRMMANMQPWPSNSYSHVPNNLQGGNNFPPQADIPRVLMQPNFNESQPSMESYQYFIQTPEMVPSPPPPAFQPTYTHPPQTPMYVATNMAVPPHMFPPNSPNDTNMNFVPGLPPSASSPNLSGTAPTMHSSLNASYNKLTNIVQCVNCGHCNHLAGSEITKLHSELKVMKEENEKLRNQLQVRQEVSHQMVPMLQQAVQQVVEQTVGMKTLLSPDAKEFVCGESKEAKIAEVPVVSAKGIENNQSAVEMPNEIEEVQPVTDETRIIEAINKVNISHSEEVNMSSGNSDNPSIKTEERVEEESSPPEATTSEESAEMVTIKTKDICEEESSPVGTTTLKDNKEVVLSETKENCEGESIPVGVITHEDSQEVVVDGIHTSCQTVDSGWDSSEENKGELVVPPPPTVSGGNSQSQDNMIRNSQQNFRGPQRGGINRGRYNERGRGRGKSDGGYNENRYQNNQRTDYRHQNENSNRPFYNNNRQHWDETKTEVDSNHKVPRSDESHYRGNNNNFPSGKDQGRNRGYSRDTSAGRGGSNNAQRYQKPTGSAARDGDTDASGRDLLTEAKSHDYQTNGKKSFLMKNVVNEMKGDLFTVDKNYSLAHCVARDFRMGSGIAVKFREEFRRVGELLDQNVNVGGCAYLNDEVNKRYIFYLVTKELSNGKPTMDSLTQSLQAMKNHCDQLGVTKLAMPHIGCGLDHLKWGLVKQAINETFQNSNIHILAYEFNAEGAPEGKSEVARYDGVSVRYKIMPLSTMDRGTGLLFFGTEDGYMDSTAISLNGRFKFENDYKTASKSVGKVFCFTKCFNNQYYIYGLIVAKTLGKVSFVDIEKCCKELARMVRNDQWSWIGLEALVEWSQGDETFTEKVVSLLRYSLPRKFVSELWVCYQQPEHDTLMMCPETNIKNKK